MPKPKRLPQDILGLWLTSKHRVNEEYARQEARDNFEAGSDGCITIGDENYERYWLESGEGFVVMSWTDYDGTRVI